VVVLDLTMPGMDGFAFLESLHAEPSLRDVPVVVVSGRELDAREAGFLQQHVARVLQKGSYDRSGLLRAVTRAIAARSGREEA
jgi:CheY-like chemotaxis protein